jgi:hypothetical protein
MRIGLGLGLGLGLGAAGVSVLAGYALGGAMPLAVMDFGRGYLNKPLSLSRASAGTITGAFGDIETVAPDIARYDWTGGARALLVEPSATNLLSRAITGISTGWSLNGASGSNLALNALALFPGVTVTSNGAIWHRLMHADEPAVTNGASYHLRVFFKFGTSGKILVTLRNNASSAEHRFLIDSNGVISLASGAFSNIGLTPLGVDGVYRLDANFVPNFTGPLSFGLGPGSATSGESVIVLGAQFETGEVGTSFINSGGAATIRAADVASIDLSAGTYDVRTVLDGGVIDVPSVYHAGGAYWPAAAAGRVRQVIIFREGAL